MNHPNSHLNALRAGLPTLGKALSAALLAAALAAAPALAFRPDASAPGLDSKADPFRSGFKQLRRLQAEDLLEGGERLRQNRLALRGDATAQILRRLNARFRASGGEFRVRTVLADGKGNRHVRLEQFLGGLPVIGGDAVVHVNASDEIYGVGGSLADGPAPAAAPRLKAGEARDIALASVVRRSAARERSPARLVFFDGVVAYETLIEEAGVPPRLWKSYLDASTGEVLHRQNRILEGAPVGGAPHPVNGSLLLGEGGALDTLSGWKDTQNIYFLRNDSARWGVYDQDLFDWSQNLTGSWGTTDRAAVSLARNMEITQAYAEAALGRNSYDNAGAFANAYVHEGTNYVNAYWDGAGFHFGDGDGIAAGPLTVLDIAAHEYGHAVTQYTSNLDYAYESGALNESYSDILGALVEFWAQPDGRAAYPAGLDGRADYLMGEDCWLESESLRDMRNPGRFGQPSYYLGTNWYTGSGDNGGVHYNSGVQNFAFYLLAEGGTGSNDGHPYAITGLGFQAAGEIAMYANMFLLTSTSQYSHAREAWILAASTLGHDVQTVRDVWTACGVLEQVNNLSVTPASLAFGSVGAGSTSVLHLTLGNNGAISTTVTGLAFGNSAFSTATPLPLTVPGGSTVQLPIRFIPPGMGPHSGNLVITSNADDNPSLSVGLSGTGTEPAGISVTPASISESALAGAVVTANLRVDNTGIADLQVTPRTRNNPSMGPLAAGPHKVLLLSAVNGTLAFADSLRALPNVDTLGLWNGYVATPVLADLQPWDVVVVVSNNYWVTPAGIGDLLADYVDAGGSVIIMGANFHSGGNWALQGRLMTPGYAPLAVTPYSIASTSLAVAANHPINQGVTALTSGLFANNVAPLGTGISLGTFTGGQLVGAYNPDKPIVSLNCYPLPGYYGGHALVQVRNAIDFVAGGRWLSVTGEGEVAVVPQGSGIDLTVTLDATQVPGGTYTGAVEFSHNDPSVSNPLVVPVTFVVDGFRRLAVSPASLEFGNRWVGSEDTLSLTLANAGDEATAITGFALSGGPDFSVIGTPPAAVPGGGTVTVRIRFRPMSLGPQTGTLEISSDAEDNPSHTITLTGAGTSAPAITLTPSSVQAEVSVGENATRTVAVGNSGGADLEFAVQGADGSLVINEFCNQPDFIEVWNRGGDRALGGWRLSWVDDAGSSVLSFAFPAGYVLKAGRRAVVRENTGTPNDSTFYAGANIGWVQGSVVAVTLADAAGVGVDFVRTTGSTAVPPSGTAWKGGGVAFTGYSAYRSENADSDSASGWATSSTPSEFLLNPGQAATGAFPAWLTVAPVAGTVGPGLATDLTLSFASAGLLGGTYSATLMVKSNDPSAPAAGSPLPVALVVDGERRITAPADLAFGSVLAGAQTARSLVLQNPGNEATLVNAAVSDNPLFTVASALPMTIPPFGSAALSVVFAPTAPGAETGALTLASDAEDNPTLIVNLSGTGTPPPQLVANPASLTRTLAAGDSGTEFLTLTNPGGGDLHWSLRYVAGASSAAARAVRDRHQAGLLPAAAPNYLDFSGRSDARIPGGPGRPALPESTVPAGPSGEAWTPLQPMPWTRGQFGLAAPGNGKLYAFGGYAGSSEFNTLGIYDIAANAWTTGAAMPQVDRGFASAVGPDGNIYKVGGLYAGAYRYSPATNTWSTIASPPVSTAWEATAVTGDDGRIYVFGGEGTSASNAVQIYDPATNAWTQGSPMPTPRLGAGAAKLAGGLLLVAGGISSGTTPTNTAAIYDPAANTWSAAAPMPVAKTHFGMTAGGDGRIYAIGGKQSYYNNTGPFLSHIEAYDPVSGAWAVVDSLPAPMAELEVAVAGNRIYVAGGTNGAFSAGLGALEALGPVSVAPASGTVAPGGSVQVAVTFRTGNLIGGTYPGSLDITHDDPYQANPLPVPTTLIVDGMRRLSSPVSSLEFGSVWVGGSAVRDLTLENAGNEATAVTSLASDNPRFAVSTPLPLTVPPFGSATIQVAFAPAAPGSETGTLAIGSDAEDNPAITVALTGTATAPPVASLNPSAFSLSLQPTDAPADRTATLSNLGGDNLGWRVASVTQTGSPIPAAPFAPALPPIRSDLIYSESNYAHPFVPGRVIVGFKPGQTGFSNPQTAASLGIREMRELAAARNPKTRLKANTGRLMMLLVIQDPEGVRRAIEVLRRDGNVAYAEPDYIQKAIATPNDPSFNLLYGMHNTGQSGGVPDADIDAPEAWERHTGNKSILIGVIDTGIDYLHPDLAANIWTNPGEVPGNGIDDDGNGFADDVHGWDFAYDDSNPTDGHYHGTHCAGTVAGVGNNGAGVAGVMWEASLAALKFLDDGGSGSTSDAVDAVNYATAMDIRITSNSWGGGGFSQALMDAIAAGGLFVAAAGNSAVDNDLSPHYPSSYALDNVLAVAATDHADALASFSCWGLTSVDLGAPGVDTYSASPGNSYQYLSGTSMATPHVSGAAGLVWTYNPGMTALEVKAALMESVDPVPSLAGLTVTGGRLNVAKALDEAGPAWLTASPLAPGTLAPGESAPITVTVNPAGLAAGQWTGVVMVATDDPANPELPITVTADIAGCRSLVVEPGAFDFGDRLIGTVAGTTLTLRNDCNAAVTVSAASSSVAAFTLASALPLTVPPASQRTITVEFRPAAVGPVSGILSLTSDADSDPVKTVSLSGRGVEPPVATVAPAQINHSLASGDTVDLDLDIGNTGGSLLEWTLSNVGAPFAPPPAYDATHYAPQERGREDARQGRPVTRASGGPDAFGYRWTDSDQSGGPGYQWLDIRATGTAVLQGCLDCHTTRALSFGFPFYGTVFNQVNITSKGWVNFGSPSNQWTNYPLPGTSMPDYLVAAFFDDLSTANSGSAVYFQDFGDRAIIQFHNLSYYSGTGNATFQIVLHRDGAIYFYYQSMTGNLLSATTGIQDGARTTGLQIQYNTAYVKDNLAVRIADQPEWLRVSAASGTVPPGGSQRLALTLDADPLPPGVYTETMILSHNNPLQPALEIPVTLIVEGGTVGGMSRVLRVGPSALSAAAGTRYFMWNLTAGGEARGRVQGSRFTLYLK